jgi:hypothetical protein
LNAQFVSVSILFSPDSLKHRDFRVDTSLFADLGRLMLARSACAREAGFRFQQQCKEEANVSDLWDE